MAFVARSGTEATLPWSKGTQYTKSVVLPTPRDTACCITCDTVRIMSKVTIRELRNHGGDVVERATRGERITITRAGKPVAELCPLRGPGASAETLLARWRTLPAVDPVALRADIDQILDPRL